MGHKDTVRRRLHAAEGGWTRGVGVGVGGRTVVSVPAEVLVLLENLHEDPEEAEHAEQLAEPSGTEAALPFLLLQDAEGASLHGPDLHVHTHP